MQEEGGVARTRGGEVDDAVRLRDASEGRAEGAQLDGVRDLALVTVEDEELAVARAAHQRAVT